jgi:hypothetical protein
VRELLTWPVRKGARWLGGGLSLNPPIWFS